MKTMKTAWLGHQPMPMPMPMPMNEEDRQEEQEDRVSIEDCTEARRPHGSASCRCLQEEAIQIALNEEATAKRR